MTLDLYPDTTNLGFRITHTIHLDQEAIQNFTNTLGLAFLPEPEPTGNVCLAASPDLRPEFRTSFGPADIKDYIYAVLHSPTYRDKYKEFLKIDFPRVPYPTDADQFWQLVYLGGQLRQIHLLESPLVDQFITRYSHDGDNLVDKPRFEAYDYAPTLPDENEEMHYPDYIGAVYINDTQCFTDVPLSAWEFYIGGYQPAQKWLKDRKGRTLTYEEILHYQRIIVALTETRRLMQEIDEVGVE